MARPKKKVTEMTDKELIRKVFAAPVRKALKAELLELNRERLKRKGVKKR